MTEEVKLEFPVELKGRGSVSTINIRRPKVRDLEIIEKYDNETAKTVHLISNLAEWSPDEVRELDISDYKKIAEKVSSFL